MTPNKSQLITIITVVYNGENCLEKTIKSVIDQTYKNIEYIIIDGGSSDRTVDIIKKYEDKISHYISESDDGIYDAMNKGMIFAKGEYILFLNAGDDFCDENIIENIFDKDEQINDDIVYGAAIVVDENRTKETYLNPKCFTKFNLLFWTTRVLCHQSLFIRKSILKPYSSKYKLKGELNWYFDLLEKVKSYKIVDFPIVYYSLGGAGDVNFKLNTVETLQVVFSQTGILGILSIPVTLYKYLKKILS